MLDIWEKDSKLTTQQYRRTLIVLLGEQKARDQANRQREQFEESSTRQHLIN